ncbi:RidA family protein [Sporosarcina limicola]|uniref:2-iminobutanoate/2-iminopropanoate deaminase n=1 Tax=Sporosarcina limicola TaxID=34101 RepID=A0A927MKQ2_9BACL|nr:RidA family protein [Sporosarcina limicola]MBE1554727.1 2-iminobutanoate/2-iminopropanoate deaminase [Sporosarcina limicola]
MKEAVLSTKAPQPIGPYSQGMISNGHLFISGQLPLNVETNRLAEGIENQARQSLDNIKSILEAKELGMDAVVKTTIFMTDLADFQLVNSIYADYFTAPFPARSTIQVAKLPMDALIEIELIAETKK